MATITPTNITTAGQAITFVAASAGGDTIAGAGNTTIQFQVKNGGGASITVTFAGVTACDQGTVHTYPVTCAAGVDTDIVIPAKAINPTTGNVAVTYSAVTSVTVAALAG